MTLSSQQLSAWISTTLLLKLASSHFPPAIRYPSLVFLSLLKHWLDLELFWVFTYLCPFPSTRRALGRLHAKCVQCLSSSPKAVPFMTVCPSVMWGRMVLLPSYLLPSIHSSAEGVCGNKTVPGRSWPLCAVLVLSAHHQSRGLLFSSHIYLLVFTLAGLGLLPSKANIQFGVTLVPRGHVGCLRVGQIKLSTPMLRLFSGSS